MKRILVIAKQNPAEALRVAAGLTLLNESVRVAILGDLPDDPAVQEQATLPGNEQNQRHQRSAQQAGPFQGGSVVQRNQSIEQAQRARRAKHQTAPVQRCPLAVG